MTGKYILSMHPVLDSCKFQAQFYLQEKNKNRQGVTKQESARLNFPQKEQS